MGQGTNESADVPQRTLPGEEPEGLDEVENAQGKFASTDVRPPGDSLVFGSGFAEVIANVLLDGNSPQQYEELVDYYETGNITVEDPVHEGPNVTRFVVKLEISHGGETPEGGDGLYVRQFEVTVTDIVNPIDEDPTLAQ